MENKTAEEIKKEIESRYPFLTNSNPIERMVEIAKRQAFNDCAEWIQSQPITSENPKGNERSANEILTAHYLEKFTYNPDCVKSHQEFKQIALDAMQEFASQEREKGIIEGFNAAREKEDLKKIDEVDGGETWLNDCLKYKDSTDYLNSKNKP